MIKTLPQWHRFSGALLAAILVCGALEAQAVTTIYKLDLGVTGSPLTAGFTAVNAGSSWTLIPTLSLNNISGEGSSDTINISFANVKAGSMGSAAQPLTTDGFYTAPGNPPTTFTISNLSAGSTVDLYGITAWSGNTFAAPVTFGGTTSSALAVGDPGTAPTRANFSYIGTAVAGSDGTLSGSFYNPAKEADLGGLYIEVTTVPEPAAWAMLTGGLGMMGMIQRMRRRNA